MNRTLRGIISTMALVAFVAMFSGVSQHEYQSAHDQWSNTTVPAWEAESHLVTERNMFWGHADGIQITGHPFFEADQQFVQDVNALYLDEDASPEMVVEARGRLWHGGNRLYEPRRLANLGLIDTSGPRIDQSAFAPDLLEAITLLQTEGLDAIKSELPIKPAEPRSRLKYLANKLVVWPMWLIAWSFLSLFMLAAHSASRPSYENNRPTGSVYYNVMKKPGQPIGRLLLFLQMAPILTLIGLGNLAVTLIFEIQRAVAIARHPNSKEVRRASKALATLRRTGASADQIAEAEGVLRSWTLYEPDQDLRPDTKATRQQRLQQEALTEVQQLRGQLVAHHEVDGIARPARPRAREKA